MATTETLRPNLIPLVDVPELLPGQPVMGTVRRWIRSGVAGVRLRSIKVGGRRYVSKTALADFITRCTGDDRAAALTMETPARRNRRRQREVKAAEEFLQEEGF